MAKLTCLDLCIVCVHLGLMKILPKPKISDIKKNWLPMYSGELACGLFGISDDYVDHYLSLDEKFMSHKESVFFVRASGHSMEPDIQEGDILVVDRSKKVFSGSILALFYNQNPICKQYLLKIIKEFFIL